MILMTSMVIMCLLLYPIRGMGFRVGLQQLLGNFEMARDSFIKKAGTSRYTLKMEAIDNLTLEHIECDCQVVGHWKNGLIVLENGKPRAVGENQDRHNLYPVHAELIQGEPLRVMAHRVNMRGPSLGWLLDRLDQGHTYYISGQMVVSRKAPPLEDIDLYRPVSMNGKVLKLHYARAKELDPYLEMGATEGELYVQFWLKPGDEAVELVMDEEAGDAAIPAVLAGYL